MLLWKGQDFRSLGIVVEQPPTISKGKKNIDVYTVPGRSGFLSVDNGTYDSFVVSVSCHFKDTVDFDNVKEFLDGFGTLSFDGKREYTAIIQNSISFDKVLMFKRFVIQFLVNPIAEDITSRTYSVLQSDVILNIQDATAEMKPIIEITGTGNIDVTINNKTFKLFDLDGTYLLDSKAKVITFNGINAAQKMQYDFPTLQPGKNSISYIGNVTSFEIEYKRAYL